MGDKHEVECETQPKQVPIENGENEKNMSEIESVVNTKESCEMEQDVRADEESHCALTISIVICSKNVSRLHHSRYKTTFTVYVTDCDLETSFIFNRQFKLQATCALRFTCKHIIAKMLYSPRYGS